MDPSCSAGLCVQVCAPRPACVSPVLSELRRLTPFVAILFGSSLCIYTGKGLLGRSCRSGEGKAVGEFSSLGIHAIVSAFPVSLRNGVQEMESYLMLSWNRPDTAIWSL